jgi:hypothetical protein
MDTKLTLKFDAEIIADAKKYAASKGQSLSRIIESYLKFLTTKQQTQNVEISPFIKSLTDGVDANIERPSEDEYKKYLEDKYK